MGLNGLGGLPSRPLTQSDLRSLSSHPDISMCDPTYQLRESPDAIISLFLEVSDQIHILLFNPEEEQWEMVETIEEPDSLTEASELDGAVIQGHFETYYEENEVELAESLQDVTTIMEAFAANFPCEPLSEDQVQAINQREFVVTAVPFVLRQCADAVVSLILAFDHPSEAKRVVGSYGYDSSDDAWQLISTVYRSEEDEALEALGEDTDDWLFSSNRYSRDELRLVEDAESWIPSG